MTDETMTTTATADYEQESDSTAEADATRELVEKQARTMAKRKMRNVVTKAILGLATGLPRGAELRYVDSNGYYSDEERGYGTFEFALDGYVFSMNVTARPDSLDNDR